MRVGIVGAGAAGLAAAYDIVRAGHEAVVYESAPFVGGQASTISVGGHPLERGYHHLFLNDTSFLELMDELEVGDRMQWYPSAVGTYVNNRLYPTARATDLLRLGALPIWERIRMGLFALRLRRLRDWKGLEDSTADEWLRHRLGGSAYRVLWEPLLRGKFGSYYDQVGMPWFWSKIQTRFASRPGLLSGELLGYPTGSYDVMFDRLRAEIMSRRGLIKLNSEVKAIEAGEDTRSVRLRVREADGTETVRSFDCVLSTAPSFVMRDIAKGLTSDYLARLDAVHYLAAVVVILELDRRLSDYYWMNIADPEVPFLGVIEHTNMLPREWYSGNHVVYLTNYLDRKDALFRMSADDLTKLYLPHLRRINREFREDWVKTVHYNAVSAAQPIIGTNYSRVIPSHRTPMQRVYLANTTQIYPEDRGTNYSIRMGREVAQMILSDCRFNWSVWSTSDASGSPTARPGDGVESEESDGDNTST